MCEGDGMEEWKEYKLGDLVTVKGGKRLPKGINLISTKNSHPYIRIRDLGKSKYLQLNSDYEYVDNETQKSISRYITNKGDVLISIVGTIGLIGIVGDSLDNANLTENCVKLIDLKNIDSNYLYYFLSSEIGQNEIKKGTVGAVQPKLPIKNIQDIDIPIPPLSIQQKIARILSSLDDKIELNNKINTNLEQQAQALFKNWFVDFEPFGGKMPEGWKVGKLSEIGTIVGGSTPSKAKKEYYTNKGIAWITPKDLSNDKSKFISHGEIDITELGFKNSSAIKMPKGTVLYSSRAPIGYIAISKNEVTTNQGFKSVIPNPNVGNAYIYYFLRSNFELIDNMASGSTFKEISGTAMKNVPVLIPDDKTLFNFQTMCETLFSQQKLLENENRNLSAIRDTLLPKLMNGEIELDEVSK